MFMGYIDMEEKTKEAIDEEGLLHSGDIGRKDKNGFNFITGRIKGSISFAYVSLYRLSCMCNVYILLSNCVRYIFGRVLTHHHK